MDGCGCTHDPAQSVAAIAGAAKNEQKHWSVASYCHSDDCSVRELYCIEVVAASKYRLAEA